MKFGVWCSVSGGVTGNRSAWLKSDGEPKLFDTLNEAQDEATRIYNNLSAASRARCNFDYTAMRYIMVDGCP